MTKFKYLFEFKNANPKAHKDATMYGDDFIEELCETYKWIDNGISQKWIENFNLLKQYVEEEEKIPSLNTEFNDVLIGKWCSRQKIKYKKNFLHKNEISLLESISDWDWCESYGEILWNNNFNLLKQYVEEEEKLPLASTVFHNVSIGNWCSYQKYNYKKNILDKNLISMLESINGWVWDQSCIEEKKWTKNFNLLKQYIEIKNKLPVSHTKFKDVSIGNWCERQVKNKEKLSNEKISMLESIDIWEWEDDWEKIYKKLNKEIVMKTQEFKIAYDDYELYEQYKKIRNIFEEIDVDFCKFLGKTKNDTAALRARMKLKELEELIIPLRKNIQTQRQNNKR